MDATIFGLTFDLSTFLVDAASALALATGGVFAIRTAMRERDGARTVWATIGFGLIWLGADELFGLHEGVEMVLNGAGVPKAPFVHSQNDFLLFIYGIIAGAVALRYIRELLNHPIVLLALVAATVALGIGWAADAFYTPDPTARQVEEDAEFTGGALFLLATYMRFRIAAGEPRPQAGGSTLVAG